jgi:hypothetical protein
MANRTDPEQRPMLVRELPLPTLLAHLIQSGRWQHPGDDILHEVIPWFEDPLTFLTSTSSVEAESQSLDMEADDERSSRLFHVARGGAGGPIWLPWLDAELAVLIAVNRRPGDEGQSRWTTATGPGDPVVVTSDAWTYPNAYFWRKIATSFEEFAAMLGITAI